MTRSEAGTKTEDIMMIIFEGWQDLEGGTKIEASAYSNFNSWLTLYLKYCELWVHIHIFSVTYVLLGNANMESERNSWGSCL